ncbi:hypothetical protein K458DRAFT_4852 [Lentithecium fluviatile CBS 122367]|uniref:G protein-coupled receptor GPR1/2/3 C-terminal domain-containing protein n=1 Tax=Lentithecium fluviatile CBS 122367 TaxID=1168545 RepID=A0A6G1JML9_9PLEO|nr:hypothetical protein K458DRAFT_4852 [Lentithecium fluviatile CBS 122367]
MASLEARSMLEKRYFPYPNSMDPMTPTFKAGLIPVALFAMMSLISVSALIGFITWRLISWRRHYKQYVGYNQYVILIYMLLIADLQQAVAFSISFHWLRLGKILAPTPACFIQAWFVHIGDVASGFFVLAIAVHTWLGVMKGYRMPYRWFVTAILLIWLAALVLTFVGPAMHGNRFFARAGGWCWVSVDYQPERLWLHYLWIFIVEFGTIAIYSHIFFHLRGRLRGIINNDSTNKLSRATKFMVMYPAVYVILTLPIAVGRMVAMAGVDMPDLFFCIAGSFLTSCGWIDAVLYTLTRRIFIGSDISGHHYNRTVTAITTNAARPGDEDIGMKSLNKDMGARTVTIVGGANRISRIVDPRTRSKLQRSRSHPNPLGESSPTGSQDSIMKPAPNCIGIVTETNIQVESARDSGSEITHGRGLSTDGIDYRAASPA